MKYQTAYMLAVKYGELKNIDVKSRLKIKSDYGFRFDFNSIDISYHTKDSFLIVRSCIQRLNVPLRQDFLNALDNLDTKYKDKLANGYLEYDTTALEVDGIDPFRLNIALKIVDDDIEAEDLNSKIDQLHIASVRWRNEYYILTFDELDNIKNLKK